MMQNDPRWLEMVRSFSTMDSAKEYIKTNRIRLATIERMGSLNGWKIKVNGIPMTNGKHLEKKYIDYRY